MDNQVQSNRRYQTTEATIEGQGGDALTSEVLRALREFPGRRIVVLISSHTAPIPAAPWNDAAPPAQEHRRPADG